MPLGHCRPDVGCFPPHDLRRVCQPHERRGSDSDSGYAMRGERGEGRISIEFLLHGGAEHNSRGKASIAISNAPMSRTRTERKADGRRTVLGLSGRIARGGITAAAACTLHKAGRSDVSPKERTLFLLGYNLGNIKCLRADMAIG